jgi:lipoprotein-releasing system permease protein
VSVSEGGEGTSAAAAAPAGAPMRGQGSARLVRAHAALATFELVVGAALSALGAATLGGPHAGVGALVLVVALVDVVRAVRARRAGEEKRELRVGGVGLFWAIAAFLLCIAGLVDFGLREALPREEAGHAVLLVTTLTITLATLASSLVLSRVVRVAQGTPGAVRLTVGALATLAMLIAQLMFSVVIVIATHDRVSFELDFGLGDSGASPLAAYLTTVDAVAYAQGVTPLLYAAYGIGGVAAVVILGGIVSSWFLVSPRVRAWVFGVLDTVVVAAFVFALYTLPFTPRSDAPGAVQQAAIALSIATLFGVRATFRLLPPLMDGIELSGFQALVAARMLRAKKSGFLTVIGFLSILAVSFSSCTLSTTLSVMGGFRADLQQKILGNHAHVVVDREYGTFEGWDPILGRVRGVDGVTGVTPYVSGEVMITSASNLAGAELRGIDPATIGDVTDLPRNMRHGRLDYLSHPEEMLHLSPEEMSGSLLVPELLEAEGGDDAQEPTPPPSTAPASDADAGPRALPEHAGLVREIDEMLAAIDQRQGGAPNVRELGPPTRDPTASRREQIAADLDEFLLPEALVSEDTLLGEPPPPPDVLPGLVVGQELARSLRLHVGDEVNVVSPNGEIGPTGPVPRTRPFRVAGIFYSGMYEYDMQMAYTDLETAQRFLMTGSGISGIEIKVDDWEHAEQAAERVRGVVERRELRVRSWQEVNRNLFGALELEKLAMFITLGIAILVASFCVVGTLTLMVQEKRREVAILKAMGAEDRQMVGMFLMQGLFIGLVGALSGLGLGYVVCFAAEHFGIHMDPEVYYIDQLPVHIDGVEFTLVGIAAVLVCVLATIYPAILGSRLKPVDALRD